MAGVIFGFVLFLLVIIATFFSLVNVLTALAGLKPARNYSAYQPKVSVIVRSWNDDAVIERCITNLLEQNYPSDKFEVIIADDSTDDKTKDICEKFSDIRYVKVPHKELKAEIIDYVINNCAVGELIAETDADAVADKNWLAEIVKPFQDRSVAGATGPVVAGNWNSLIAATRAIEDFWHFCSGAGGRYSLAKAGIIYGGNKAYRKSAWMEVGGHPTKTMAEDAEISMKFVEKGYKVVFARNALVMQEEVGTVKQYLSERKRWTSADFAVWNKYGNIIKSNMLHHFLLMSNFSMDAWLFFSWLFIWFEPLFIIPLLLSLITLWIGFAEYKARLGFYLFAGAYTILNPLLQTLAILGVLKDRYFGSGVKWDKVWHHQIPLKWPVKKI
ncbi:MAG: glycosyltransferase family 2 protein [Candidatus Nanoarchaeia archaeon]|nr:glycosyltransferase family 2 protein [Candidatus Nanoarchaeia archaeon]MDD5238899.1 glycosyltransferase family 2 protein [Candidatus Nanoarchaeia archaeon]